MGRANVRVAQPLLPVRVLQTAHSQEWLCYPTIHCPSERSEEFLFEVKSKRKSDSSATCGPRNDSFFFFLQPVNPTSFCRINVCLLYTSPSPRDRQKSRMPSSA